VPHGFIFFSDGFKKFLFVCQFKALRMTNVISSSLHAGLFLHRRKAEDVGPHRKVFPQALNT
jgi:hypothetical protein